MQSSELSHSNVLILTHCIYINLENVISSILSNFTVTSLFSMIFSDHSFLLLVFSLYYFHISVYSLVLRLTTMFLAQIIIHFLLSVLNECIKVSSRYCCTLPLYNLSFAVSRSIWNNHSKYLLLNGKYNERVHK